MGTRTSAFGVSGRESHDSSAFYQRFDKITESTDTTINPAPVVDAIYCATSEKMSELPDNSVALSITSPPYHVGKEYDTDQSFDDYLDMLHRVIAETERVLIPGGRAAINVANLGRKPYIPLTTFIDCMATDVGLFPRAQIIWQKAEGANGSCAWGSFQSASNPVMRDLHEYIMVYSKGRFGRPDKGVSTITKEHFMRDTLSVWKFPPESAKRVNFPAPFPVELPSRLINLYSYEDDLILDQFLGSGTTAIAAINTGRHFVGYDTEMDYVTQSWDRISKETDWFVPAGLAD